MKSHFLTPLRGEWEDDEIFRLISPFLYYSEIIGGIIGVPEGYRTDFASVPRVPIAYMLWGGRAHHEAVPHDFGYQAHRFRIVNEQGNFVEWIEASKTLTDRIFMEAMTARNKAAWIRYPMVWGVKLGGTSSYFGGPERAKKLGNVFE